MKASSAAHIEKSPPKGLILKIIVAHIARALESSIVSRSDFFEGDVGDDELKARFFFLFLSLISNVMKSILI